MPIFQANTRIILNTTNTAGQVATTPPSNDHTDGTWQPTDVYPGELFVNYQDGNVTMRTASGIKYVGLVPSNAVLYSASVTIPSGSVQLLNAVPYTIIPANPSGTIEIVSATVKVSGGSTPFPAGGYLYLIQGSTGSANYANHVVTGNMLTATNIIYRRRMVPYDNNTSYNSEASNTAISLWASVSEASAGNGTITVDVLYRILTS